MMEPAEGLPISARSMENSMPVVTAAAAAALAAPVPPVTPALLLSLMANCRFWESAEPEAFGPRFPARMVPAAIKPTAGAEEPEEPGTIGLAPPWRLTKSTEYGPDPLPHLENK